MKHIQLNTLHGTINLHGILQRNSTLVYVISKVTPFGSPFSGTPDQQSRYPTGPRITFKLENAFQVKEV